MLLFSPMQQNGDKEITATNTSLHGCDPLFQVCRCWACTTCRVRCSSPNARTYTTVRTFNRAEFLYVSFVTITVNLHRPPYTVNYHRQPSPSTEHRHLQSKGKVRITLSHLRFCTPTFLYYIFVCHMVISSFKHTV